MITKKDKTRYQAFVKLCDSYLNDKLATHFNVTALCHLKTICPLYQIWKTKLKYAANWEAFSKIVRPAIKDNG